MSTETKKPDTEVKDILADAFSKYKKGEEKYGVIDLDKDPRDFIEEAEAELLDAIVYMAFEISKLRRLKRLRDTPMCGHDVGGKIEEIGQINWMRYYPKRKEGMLPHDAETCCECGKVYLSLYPLRMCGDHEGLELVKG